MALMDFVQNKVYCNLQQPDIIAFWNSQLERLSPKKRKNWGGRLWSGIGVQSQVRNVDGRFEIKVTQNLKNLQPKDMQFPAGGWAPILEIGEVATKEFLAQYYDLPDDNVLLNVMDLNPRLAEARVAGNFGEVFDAIVEENRTYKHTGRVNHRVAIPTATGQPIRG